MAGSSAEIHQPDIDADFLLRGEAVVDDGLDGLRLIPPGRQPHHDRFFGRQLRLAYGGIIHEEGRKELPDIVYAPRKKSGFSLGKRGLRR